MPPCRLVTCSPIQQKTGFPAVSRPEEGRERSADMSWLAEDDASSGTEGVGLVVGASIVDCRAVMVAPSESIGAGDSASMSLAIEASHQVMPDPCPAERKRA